MSTAVAIMPNTQMSGKCRNLYGAATVLLISCKAGGVSAQQTSKICLKKDKKRLALRLSSDELQKKKSLRSSQLKPRKNQVYEREASLIDDDRCNSVVSVDGWVRHHNDQYAGRSEHARSLGL